MSSNIEVKLDVLNQKGSPALFASSLATRPAASFEGRLFEDSDNPSTGVYRDTGSLWVQIADAGAGTTGTLQQVTTNGNSTTTGITITTNGLGIGTTIPGANILVIHGTTGVLAQLENTTTNNSLLSFRNQGAGAWSIGNGYNAGANDFIIYNAVSFVNSFTIKGTGQTFVGSDTTSSGLLVVNSATSDNHIVCIGANAPSIRLRNTGTSPTLNVGLGISTATNNFIQGSVSGNFCIFNASTTASPILFGVYDSGAGNTVEAARISASRNLLVGTVTDSGYKLSISGTSFFNGQVALNSNLTFGANVNAQQILLFESGTAKTGLGVVSGETRLFGWSSAVTGITFGFVSVADGTTYSPKVTIPNGGNFLIGYSVDSGQKLQVNGSALIAGAIAIGNSVAVGVAVASTHKVSILIGGVQYYLLASNV